MSVPSAARRLIAALIVAAASCGAALALEAPRLEIEAPPELARVAERIEGYDRSRLETAMSLVGLDDPGPPIRVVVAPEGSAEARAAPSWASGYAYGSMGIVVLIPSRQTTYPYSNYEALLHHEVTHVLIARAARGQPLPRWFEEGVSMAAARDWGLEDRARIILDLIPGGRVSLDRLDALFAGEPSQVERAYAISGAFVRDSLREYGWTLPAKILDRVAEGASFEAAFRESAGLSLEDAERSYHARQSLWNRWVPILTSSFSIWAAISLMALYARRARRSRDARKKAEWEREEALEEHAPEDSSALPD